MICLSDILLNKKEIEDARREAIRKAGSPLFVSETEICAEVALAEALKLVSHLNVQPSELIGRVMIIKGLIMFAERNNAHIEKE